MIEIVIPSLYILAGICIYACFTHLSLGLTRPFNTPHIIFGFSSLSIFLFSIAHIQTLQAESIPQFVYFLKWAIFFIVLFYGLIFWFVDLYTNKIPRTATISITLIYSGIIILNLIKPNSLQYESVSSLIAMNLPWGEKLTYAIGQSSHVIMLSALILHGTMIYLCVVLAIYYFQHRSKINLGMLLAMLVMVAFATQGILVRLGIIKFIPLGMYGFLAMVIVMSQMMSNENRQKLKIATLVYESSNEGMMVTDHKNNIIAFNNAFLSLTGYTNDELMGRNPNLFNSDRNDPHLYESMWNELKRHGKWQGEIWNKRKNGNIYPESTSITAIFNHHGEVSHYVSLHKDVSKEKENEEKIWRQANFDELTGLLNRRSISSRLEQEIKKAERLGLSLAVMLVDLDEFKEVNDTLGHSFGDDLLNQATQRMLGCIRNTDAIGRLGGDEFLIILGEIKETSSIGRIAHDLLASLSEAYRLGNDVVHSSASIGITVYPEDASHISDLLKNADQAMYEAKRQGRNSFRYYTSSMQESANKRVRVSRDLLIAISDDQFRIHYQPILDLKTGKICKAEALIRWQHPEHGLISPADFIPIAEDTSLIVPIGNWVFLKVAKDVIQLRAEYDPEFQVSINKSPVQFRNNKENHDDWFKQLAMLGLSGDSIVIEITENLLMEANKEISSQLLAFRDNGLQVALDDFGTGYSSLSYLKKFDVDYIKIDQSFIRNLTPKSEDMVLCKAMIVMAHKLGLKVIAEGIETQQQFELLKRINCDYGQGYYFAKPLPLGEFVGLLQNI